jgi:integrase
MVAAKKVVLTPRALDALKPAPAGKRYVVWDAMAPHLGVRVTESGSRSFIVVRRRPGQLNPDTHVIGKFPAVKLKDASAAVPAILEMLSEGKIPREVEAERRRVAEVEQRRRVADTFGAAVADFIADGALAGLRSGRETEAILRREFLGQTWERVERDGRIVTEWSDGPNPIWRATPVANITRRDMIETLDAIKRRGGKHAARHALGAARKFFNWCVEGERFGVEVSPSGNVRDKTLGFAKDGRELKRRRVLTDAELRDVWAAAEDLTALQRKKVLTKNPEADVSRVFDLAEPLVKTLILTGQRLNDIACARWSEIDIDKATLTVPPERYKTGIAQEVPLSPAARDIIKAMPRFGRGYAFTTTGGTRPISGMSKMKGRIEDAIAERRKKASGEPMPPWVLHDLRRTVRTRLVSDLGIEAFIAERVIGHALPGLHAVYDQGSHRDQRRDALDRWADALAVIVGGATPPEGSKVVPPEEVERARWRRRA